MKSKNEPVKVDWGLKFYLDVLKLDSLHFGLWEDEPLTVEGARQAQKNYTDRFLSKIPDGVEKIADAGCGIGGTALKLKERGYTVDCINPDAYQEKIFRQKTGGKIPFYRTTFENFAPPEDKEYDLILMSESSQYMDTEKMVARASRLLKPGGYLLIADYFRKEDTDFYKTCKVKDEFKTAVENNFSLMEKEDITERAVPTLEAGKIIFEEYGLPVLNIISGYLKQEAPVISKITKFIFSGKIKKIQDYLYRHTPRKLDSEKFKKEMNYLFLLYRLKEEVKS
ncbi:MAG: class I SAM-dependent methyltransferase [Elusimicrobiota bacterium]